MPTYEYECKSCGYSFDVFQNIRDEALKICPQCGKEVRRIINGGTGVIFMGSGFYVTDKKNGGVKTDSSAKPAPKAPGPEASGKVEPAGPSATKGSPAGEGSEKKAAG
ncbi:MAG: zinc ribbon domain-containing protein [Treponema sp.]|jgi:putative FmdB family regulatory protein|nr:zinc ribbon domain-containing protein [Treponema sp.]